MLGNVFNFLNKGNKKESKELKEANKILKRFKILESKLESGDLKSRDELNEYYSLEKQVKNMAGKFKLNGTKLKMAEEAGVLEGEQVATPPNADVDVPKELDAQVITPADDGQKNISLNKEQINKDVINEEKAKLDFQREVEEEKKRQFLEAKRLEQIKVQKQKEAQVAFLQAKAKAQAQQRNAPPQTTPEISPQPRIQPTRMLIEFTTKELKVFEVRIDERNYGAIEEALYYAKLEKKPFVIIPGTSERISIGDILAYKYNKYYVRK